MVATNVISDTSNAYIVKQNPEPETQLPTGEMAHNHIRAGSLWDIWISTTPPVRDTTTNQAPPEAVPQNQ